MQVDLTTNELLDLIRVQADQLSHLILAPYQSQHKHLEAVVNRVDRIHALATIAVPQPDIPFPPEDPPDAS